MPVSSVKVAKRFDYCALPSALFLSTTLIEEYAVIFCKPCGKHSAAERARQCNGDLGGFLVAGAALLKVDLANRAVINSARQNYRHFCHVHLKNCALRG